MRYDTTLALDGPLNGTYISPEVAKASGYRLTEWTTGESIYVHSTVPPEFDGSESADE